MSYDEPSEAAEKPKKRTIQEFLKQYRSLALPNAKRFRKRTKIQNLDAERAFMVEMVRRAAALNATANKIIKDLINESNFAVKDEDILWVADDAALEAARKYLKEFGK